MPRVRVLVAAVDVARLDADVVALKFAGGLTGASRQIAGTLGLEQADIQRAIPAEGDLQVFPGGGRIRARHAAFLHVAPAHRFTHDHVRRFSADLLRGLKGLLPSARHVGLTTHGVMFGMDYERSLGAEVAGCVDAVSSGACPEALERITIVDRSFEMAQAQQILSELLPDGGIDMPAGRAPGVPAAAGGAPSAFDVFISFKSEDADTAAQIFDLLGRNGFRVFFSRESLPRLGSDEYHRQIDIAIDQARHMVVVASSHDRVMSQWVQYEWRLFLGERLAGRKSGNLITVITPGMEISALPISLRNREVVRMTPGDLPRLLEFLRPADRFDRVVPGAPPRAEVREAGRLTVAVNSLLETSWTEARRQAPLLNVDGEPGWRLPSLEELREIRSCGIVPDRSCYWSAEEAGEEEAYYMHFDDGHVGQGPKSFSNGLAALFVRTRDQST